MADCLYKFNDFVSQFILTKTKTTPSSVVFFHQVSWVHGSVATAVQNLFFFFFLISHFLVKLFLTRRRKPFFILLWPKPIYYFPEVHFKCGLFFHSPLTWIHCLPTPRWKKFHLSSLQQRQQQKIMQRKSL